MRNFTAHNEVTRKKMLDEINLSSVEDLFEHIPVKMKSLDLPDGLSEMEVQKRVKALSKKNKTDYISFVGGGCYNKFIPAAISQVAQRFEFLTEVLHAQRLFPWLAEYQKNTGRSFLIN